MNRIEQITLQLASGPDGNGWDMGNQAHVDKKAELEAELAKLTARETEAKQQEEQIEMLIDNFTFCGERQDLRELMPEGTYQMLRAGVQQMVWAIVQPLQQQLIAKDDDLREKDGLIEKLKTIANEAHQRELAASEEAEKAKAEANAAEEGRRNASNMLSEANQENGRLKERILQLEQRLTAAPHPTTELAAPTNMDVDAIRKMVEAEKAARRQVKVLEQMDFKGSQFRVIDADGKEQIVSGLELRGLNVLNQDEDFFRPPHFDDQVPGLTGETVAQLEAEPVSTFQGEDDGTVSMEGNGSGHTGETEPEDWDKEIERRLSNVESRLAQLEGDVYMNPPREKVLYRDRPLSLNSQVG